MKAVILAGGKGKRLLPYTTNFPKPLMPIGDKPILEIIIKKLCHAGISNITLSTGYLEELIRAYFQDGKKFGVNIQYSKEEEPLGTAGPLNLIKEKLDETFLLMNGDVLCDVDLNRLYEHHKNSKSDATIVISKRDVYVDFGVVNISGISNFESYIEKPVFNYFVSTGIYLFQPEVLSHLPSKGFFNLPDFIILLHNRGRKVSCYVHEGYWLDIGRAEDYEKACKEYE